MPIVHAVFSLWVTGKIDLNNNEEEVLKKNVCSMRLLSDVPIDSVVL